jgi:serine/threonine-protein kinase
MSAHLHDEPPRASAHGAPRMFDRVLSRALAKDPDARFPSAGDLGRAAVAAARGEHVTESERSVARGPAAPATVAPTDDGDETVALGADGDETVALGATAATRAEPAAAATAATRAAPAPRPDEPAPRRLHRPSTRRTAVAGIAAVAGLALAGILLGLVLDGPGDAGRRTGPLSRNEVRSAAEAFATAYGNEDAAALRRAVTRDVLRVLPSGVARGRDAVVAQYESQFDGQVDGYELRGLDVSGGTAGRASGEYRVRRRGSRSIEGRIVLGVVRDRGRPRIALIAATPRT